MFKNLCKGSSLMPSFSKASSFGLEISDESLKFAELVHVKDSIKTGRYGSRRIAPGIIEAGEIMEPELFEEILSVLKKEEGIKSVHVSLPEEKIFIFKIRLEKAGLKNIRKGIELSLEYNIPMSDQAVVFDYKILNEDNQSWEVQVIVIAKNIIESYLSAFENSNISISSFETKAQATAQSVIKKVDFETHMIVNLGATHTGISIVSNGIVILDSTLNASGEMFSDNIHVLREEISKHFLYWHTHKDEDGKVRPSVEKIFLCGGGMDLTALADYLSGSLKHKVEVANVWVNILDIEKNIPEMNFEQSLLFTAPLGLALEGVK